MCREPYLSTCVCVPLGGKYVPRAVLVNMCLCSSRWQVCAARRIGQHVFVFL